MALFVCYVYVSQVVRVMVAMLNGDAVFVELSRPHVWCAWLIFISCET